MNHLRLDQYPPLARKALIFLNAAKSMYKITNRKVGSEEVSYYLLSHAVELSIKAVAYKKTGHFPLRTHDKEELAEQYQIECGFSQREIATIIKLKNLNDGPGGLRYDNQPIGQFLPSTFNEGVSIVERLLKTFIDE
jgi:HEPN domain-containing protein